MHNTRRAGKWFSGSNLASFTRNITFSGFNQNIRTDAQGNGQTDYVILDTDGWGSVLSRCFYVNMTLDKVLFAGTYIHFPAGSPPPSDSSCWFDPNAICAGGTANPQNHTQWETDIWLVMVSFSSAIFNHFSNWSILKIVVILLRNIEKKISVFRNNTFLWINSQLKWIIMIKLVTLAAFSLSHSLSIYIFIVIYIYKHGKNTNLIFIMNVFVANNLF